MHGGKLSSHKIPPAHKGLDAFSRNPNAEIDNYPLAAIVNRRDIPDLPIPNKLLMEGDFSAGFFISVMSPKIPIKINLPRTHRLIRNPSAVIISFFISNRHPDLTFLYFLNKQSLLKDNLSAVFSFYHDGYRKSTSEKALDAAYSIKSRILSAEIYISN